MKQPAYEQEAELVAGLQARDQAAFSRLYTDYNVALYRVLLGIVNDQGAAQDLLQDTFVKAWHKVDTYDSGKGRLYTWLLNIAKNTAIDHGRRKSTRPSLTHWLSDEPTATAVGQHFAVSPLRVECIGATEWLDTLEPVQAQLIAMRYLQGWSNEELSKALDMPLGTVKTRIREGLIKLRKLFTSADYDPV